MTRKLSTAPIGPSRGMKEVEPENAKKKIFFYSYLSYTGRKKKLNSVVYFV